jgi:hypothetical protein
MLLSEQHAHLVMANFWVAAPVWYAHQSTHCKDMLSGSNHLHNCMHVQHKAVNQAMLPENT